MPFITKPLNAQAGRRVLIRALEVFAENPEADVDPILNDLQDGLRQGLLLRAKDSRDACGVAVWHYAGLTKAFAEVNPLYVDPEAPPGAAEALTDAVWKAALANPDVEMISVRVREGQDAIRAVLLGRGAVIFRRNLMAFNLLTGKLRRVPRPQGYSIVNWRRRHDDQVQALAPQVMRGSIDEVVVVDAQADRVSEALLSIRHNNHPEYGECVEEATLVALDATGAVVGYVLTIAEPLFAVLLDMGVHPAHRRRGLGQALVGAVLQNLTRMDYSMLLLIVTARNTAALHLYEQLGFEVLNTGEMAIWWRDGRQRAWQNG